MINELDSESESETRYYNEIQIYLINYVFVIAFYLKMRHTLYQFQSLKNKFLKSKEFYLYNQSFADVIIFLLMKHFLLKFVYKI